MTTEQPRSARKGLQLVVVCLLLAVGGVAGVAHSPARSARAQPGSPEQTAEFEALTRREDRVVFGALVSGDPSQFPSVFYNAPTVLVDPALATSVARAGDAVTTTLKTSTAGPVGAPSGYLSFRVADVVNVWNNIRAWDAIVAHAKAEGRAPTSAELATMPYGENPYPRKYESDWVDFPDYVWDVAIDGDHATAKRAFLDPSQAVGDWLNNYGGYYVSYVFTRVNGTWYVSNEDRFFPVINQPTEPSTDAAP